MKQGDIIIVPFPFTNMEDSKVRPAVILSNKKYNSKRNIIIVAISTKSGDKNFAISLKQGNIKNGEIHKESFIRLQNIFTIEKRLAIKKVAKLKVDFLKNILNKVQSFISFEE